MGEIMAVIVILLLIVMVFVPLAYYNYTTVNIEDVKQTLNLSSKVLVNNIKEDLENLGELGKGYDLEDISLVDIDREKLLQEFDGILYSNCSNEEKYKKFKSCIVMKVLVMNDKFFITNKVKDSSGPDDAFKDVWGSPMFYTKTFGGQLYYLNTKNDKVYCYDAGGEKVYRTLDDIDMSEFDKSKYIIDKINYEVEYASQRAGVRNKLNIKIKNPYDPNIEEQVKYANFNVLDGGITFFVVYGENAFLSSNGKDFNFKNYNVVGYSMSF